MVTAIISEDSPHFTKVKQLWRAHSDTLGFFPAGAFQDYARAGRIIGALNESDDCVGYLLYRIAKGRAVIAHFCVDKAARNKGYARALITELVSRTKGLRGIVLDCRRDFAASKTWPRLGFHPIGERPGRSEVGSILVRWYLDHGQPQLFQEFDDPAALKAAIDSNVFLDLVDGANEESSGLLADWIQPFITLACTVELLTDLNRNEDAEVRRRRAIQSQQFSMLHCSHGEFCLMEKQLAPLLPANASPQDESDFRHLIRAAASEADVFVTRDDSILKLADRVFDICGLSIVRPAELIGRIDSLQRQKEYQRRYIAGTREVVRERIHLSDGALITSIALHGEPQWELAQALNRYLSDPQRCACHKVSNGNELMAFYVVEREQSVDRVPIMRICGKRQSGTIARAILTSLVRQAVMNGSTEVVVSETTDTIDDACRSLGFLKGSSGWLKPILTGLHTIQDAASLIDSTDPAVSSLLAAMPVAATNAVVASDIEHILFPAKLSDSPLPSFIVPIWPQFAEQLFDERLAKGLLFGADVDLALNPESVYYRAARPGVLKCPGRVLWYVKKSDEHAGSMSIRACSRIVELRVDCPKPLFSRYRRYGVYEWQDLVDTANGDLTKKIMAFRFDDTELLPPIAWKDFQPILKSHGINTTFQSPVAISSQVFGEIYSAAFNSSGVRRQDSVG